MEEARACGMTRTLALDKINAIDQKLAGLTSMRKTLAAPRSAMRPRRVYNRMPHHSSSGTEGIFSYCIYTVGETSAEDIHVARKDLLKEVRVGFCRRLAFPVISNFPLNSHSHSGCSAVLSPQ